MGINEMQTITLGMGCFWSPDALFGQLAGVIRTRVGYAGGTSTNPSYRELGDHSETVEMDFDPALLALEKILDVFWGNHNPVNINDYKGRQYRSIVLYRDETQLRIIQKVITSREEQGKGRPETEISPYTGFFLAEERHQKYYLKRYPDAMDKLSTLFGSSEELTDSTLAARLNGLAKGYTNLSLITSELETWAISSEERNQIIRLIQRIKW